MQEHHDPLATLNSHLPLKDKLVSTHQLIQKSFPFIARVAVTLYDPKTNVLKTYMHSSGDDDPLPHYQATLDDAPSLKKILAEGEPRVINHLLTVEDSSHEHSKRIGRQGYAASYTLPMFNNGTFFGFLFFNAYEPDVFTEDVLSQMDLYGHLASLMIINELSAIDTLNAAVRTSSHMTHLRDPETGSHLDRMSRYSRLIARALAESYDLDDDYIEHVFMFAPLHDIGKIGIPDSILLKPGKLNKEERSIMMTHALKGRQMIDEIIKNFGLGNLDNIHILQNIAHFHHECVNGSGYPEGRQVDNIPLEARIIAVADMFDALTSKRPYKEAWSNDDAFALLEKIAGEQLDRDCVQALVDSREKVEKIQNQFQENWYG